MAKVKKVEFGIEITKPWSKEMYAHNEEVEETLRERIVEMWDEAYGEAEADFNSYLEDDQQGMMFGESDPLNFNEAMQNIQTAITCYSFGGGYEVDEIVERMWIDFDNAPTYRLKEISEDLDIKLGKTFIGFN